MTLSVIVSKKDQEKKNVDYILSLNYFNIVQRNKCVRYRV